MSFPVDKIYNNLGVNQGIDVQAVKDIANQIFANTQDGNSIDLKNFDFSKLTQSNNFDIELYRTNPETSIQAALRSSDVDLKLSENFAANVQFLNSQAAQKNAEQITEYNPELETPQVKPVEEATNEPAVKINIFEPKANAHAVEEPAPTVEEINTTALRTTDADVKLVRQTSESVQLLNTQAAKEYYTAQKVDGQVVLPADNLQKTDIRNIFVAVFSQETSSSQNMDNNRRGSNPFSFYMAQPKEEKDDNKKSKPINLIA